MSTGHTDGVSVGSQWRNKRTGVVAEVTDIKNDHVHLLRPRGRPTKKWVPHFLLDYEPAPLSDDPKP